MKSLSTNLLDQAVLAMAAAIELYNKPAFPYRNEAFTILAINGWELLLKAKWLALHQNKKRCLYVYHSEKTRAGTRGTKRRIRRSRSGSPLTYGIDYLAKQLVNRKMLHALVIDNIHIMVGFRDSATHFINASPEFSRRLYEIGAACVKNFVGVVRDWFNRDITEFGQHLMPLSFVDVPSSQSISLLTTEEKRFLSFMSSIDTIEHEIDSQYSISVDVELRFTRSKSRDAGKVQITDDPTALAVRITEDDIRDRYPWDFKELTAKCRGRYVGFKCDLQYHSIRKRLESDDRFRASSAS